MISVTNFSDHNLYIMRKQSFTSSVITAAKGFWLTVISERNIRIQVVVCLLTIITGLFFKVTFIEWVALVFAMGLVIGFEIMNSAIELWVDWISPEHHTIAGRVKDVAAGAVFFVSLVAIAVGLLIFVPYMMKFMN